MDLQELLKECDKEQIQCSGSIISDGIMLFIDKKTFKIKYEISKENLNLKGINIKDLFFDIIEIFKSLDSQIYFKDIQIENKIYLAKIYEIEKFYILETINNTNTYKAEHKKLQDLYNVFMSEDIYNNLTRFIKNLTDYERVMLYKFDEEFNGEVIAEEKNNEFSSYLFHHFPSSDIPSQARELYKKNRVRFISDVDDKCLLLDKDIVSSDLSDSSLRAVSKMHIEYLKNMDVKASMSISIIIKGRLWGLIACHSSQKMLLSMSQVKFLTFLSHIISQEIYRIENEQYYKQKLEIETLFERFLIKNKQINFRNNDELSNARILKDIANIFKSDYCCIVSKDNIFVQDEYFYEPIRLLENLIKDEKFFTNNLSSIDIRFEKFKDELSGAFIYVVDKAKNHKIIFFRKEESKTIKWAGKPAKDFTNGEVSPRKSFDDWVEVINSKSKPWEKSIINMISYLFDKYKNEFFNTMEYDEPYEIISQAKDSMVITSSYEDDNKILFINDAFCELYGYEKDEVIGKNPRFLQLEDRNQRALEQIREAIKNEESITTIVRNYTKFKEMKFIEVSITPIFSKKTMQVKYFLGIQKDVTKEQKILRDLRNMF